LGSAGRSEESNEKSQAEGRALRVHFAEKRLYRESLQCKDTLLFIISRLTAKSRRMGYKAEPVNRLRKGQEIALSQIAGNTGNTDSVVWPDLILETIC
jgi:hypothetical protein